jgi:hypothetical protein
MNSNGRTHVDGGAIVDPFAGVTGASSNGNVAALAAEAPVRPATRTPTPTSDATTLVPPRRNIGVTSGGAADSGAGRA